MMQKSVVAVCVALCLLASALLMAAPGKPKSVIHIVTVKWKADANPAEVDKAIKAVETMNYPGLKNVWTKTIKKQLPEGYANIIVMEFESEAALKSYSGSAAQKEWYKLYMAVRDESRTHDVTN
jgi:antibiotic biosynthesis monooxygenase (ABM) superfamily enzyme